MIKREIKTALADVWLEKGVVYTRFYRVEGNLEQAKEHVAMVVKEFADLIPLVGLTDISEAKSSNKIVRDYLASEEVSKHLKVTAILMKSGISKIMGNLFLQFAKPQHPIKLFTDEEKALEWLQQYVK